MKTASFGVKLFLKAGRLKDDGTAVIYARIRTDRNNKMELTTNKSVAPIHWDGKGRVVKHPDAKQINKHLEAFVSKINNAYSELYVAQQEITLDAIKALVLGQAATPQHTLLSVAQEHNSHFKSMLGIKYSQGSYKNYKTSFKYLTEFIPMYNGKPDVLLTSVNYKFCEAFFTYLTTKKDCHTNGANKQLQRLKKFVNYAIKLGYIQTNPMASFTLEFDPVNKVALTVRELERLMVEQIRSKGVSVILLAQNVDEFDQPQFNFSSLCEIGFLLKTSDLTGTKKIQKFLGLTEKEMNVLVRSLEKIEPGQGVSNIREFRKGELFNISQFYKRKM